MAKVDIVVELEYNEIVTALVNCAKESSGVKAGGSSIEWLWGDDNGEPDKSGTRSNPKGALVTFGKQAHQSV